MRDLQIPFDGGNINIWHRPPEPGSSSAVLIHGLTGTSRWWIPVIGHLPDQLGLIAIDARGRGQSWQAPGPFDLRTLAEDVGRCLDHLSVDSAVIAGYSMGGWVASLFALNYPTRAHRVVLVDGGLPFEMDPDLSPDETIEQVVGPSVARLSMTFPSRDDYLEFWKAHPSLTERWRPDLNHVFAYEIHQRGDSWSVRANREAILEAGRGLVLDGQARDAAARATVPTTLLAVDHGMLDEPGGFMPRATAEKAAAANPHLDVELHEGLNHYTLMMGDGAPIVAGAIAR